MTKYDHRFIFSLVACFILATAYLTPEFLSDRNTFLAEFVGAPLLSVLGFITAVTIASANNVHLHLNNLADKTTRKFTGTKRALLNSIASLVVSFGVAVALVVIKPLLPLFEGWAAGANGIALLVIAFDLLVMFDISRTVLMIPPAKDVN